MLNEILTELIIAGVMVALFALCYVWHCETASLFNVLYALDAAVVFGLIKAWYNY